MPYDFSMEYLDLMDFGEDFGYGADYTFDFDESGRDAVVNGSDNSASDMSVASIKNCCPCCSYPLQRWRKRHYFVYP
jgi:hypothetical protein